MNKDLKNIFKSLIIALSVLGFSVLGAQILYQPKKTIKRGFEVEIKTTDIADAKNPKPITNASVTQNKAPKADIASMIENANVELGAKTFKKCATCHSIEKNGANKLGPNLYGIVGKKKASASGFSYSNALMAKGGSWTIEDLNQWLTKPKDFVPGTKMGFAGLKKDKDRAEVIAYLKAASKD